MHDPFARVPAPLRLGAVPWSEADALVHALEAPAQRDTPEALLAALNAGELDAALLPPLIAWHLEGVRFVPGIALTRQPDAAPSAGDQSWHDHALRMVLGVGERLTAIEAAWYTPEPRPLVLLVWACRARAPHAQIRRTLVAAQRAGESTAAPSPFAIRLGSDESDALRALLALAKANELLPEGQQLVYC